MKGTISEAELLLLRSRLDARPAPQGGQGRAAPRSPRRLRLRRGRPRRPHARRGGARGDPHRLPPLRGARLGRQVLFRWWPTACFSTPLGRRTSASAGQANLPGDPRLSHQPRLCAGLCLRAQEAAPEGRRERPGGGLLRRPPDRGVGGLHPRTSPRLRDWETYLANRDKLRGNWTVPVGAGGAPRGHGAPAGLVSLRALRAQDARRLLGQGSQPRYVCVQGSSSTGRRAPVSRSAAASSTRRGRRGLRLLEPASVAATAAALSEAETHHAAACAPSSSQSSGPPSRPSGRGASSTPSNPRTGSWPQPRARLGAEAGRPAPGRGGTGHPRQADARRC